MLMVDMTLDTHAFVKRLTAAGMPEPQAEVITSLVATARDVDSGRYLTAIDLKDVATRQDLAALAARIEGKIEALPTRSDLAQFATKTELAALPTKVELAQFATKSDLSAMASQSATKADVAALPTKADLGHFATRSDLAELKSDLQRWTVGLVGAAVFLNAVTVFGAVLALAKMLGH